MSRLATEIDNDVQELRETVYGNGQKGVKAIVIEIQQDIKWIKIIGGWFAGIFSAILIAMAIGIIKIFLKI